MFNSALYDSVINVSASFFMVLIVGWFILLLHDLLTPTYKTWVEIHQGNVAAGLASAGKIIGIGLIAWSSIHAGMSILFSLVWLLIGGALLILGYFLFELLTPKIAVCKEIGEGNRAVGLVSMALSISTGVVISACIA